MATPPMLGSRVPLQNGVSRGPDPVVWLAVGLMTLIALGLGIAGVLAVYDVKTPASLAPLVAMVAVLFGLMLLTLVLGAAVRHARRIGR
ncbi:MAG: hypothetical protein ABR541_06320 [Candidatus Dormibacteria bacterium]